MNPYLKDHIYRTYPYWILLLAGVVLVGNFLLLKEKLDSQSLITVLGGLFSVFYFIQKQALEEARMFKETFDAFNQQYSRLNDQLNEIRNRNISGELTKAENDTLDDYFNLCGEEFLMFRRGVIYPEVWESWCRGITYFISDRRIDRKWKEEESSGSYYGLTEEEIRKTAAKNKVSTKISK